MWTHAQNTRWTFALGCYGCLLILKFMRLSLHDAFYLLWLSHSWPSLTDPYYFQPGDGCTAAVSYPLKRADVKFCMAAGKANYLEVKFSEDLGKGKEGSKTKPYCLRKACCSQQCSEAGDNNHIMITAKCLFCMPELCKTTLPLQKGILEQWVVLNSCSQKPQPQLFSTHPTSCKPGESAVFLHLRVQAQPLPPPSAGTGWFQCLASKLLKKPFYQVLLNR